MSVELDVTRQFCPTVSKLMQYTHWRGIKGAQENSQWIKRIFSWLGQKEIWLNKHIWILGSWLYLLNILIQREKKRGDNWQGWQSYGMASEGWANQLLLWGYLSTDLLLTGSKNHGCQILLKYRSLSGCQACKACYFDAACLDVEGLIWKSFSLIDVVFPFGFLGKWSN